MIRRVIHPLMFVLAAYLVITACACGGSLTKNANKSLATALSATNAARDTFVDFDKDHQLGLVDDATSREDAESALAKYRSDRARVLQAFTAAYSAIGAAAAMIPLVEKGEKKEADFRAILFDAVAAALEVKNAVDQISAATRGSK